MKIHPEYTVTIKQEDDYWVRWIEEIPGVNCQETTREELLESLSITLKEAIEFNRKDILVKKICKDLGIKQCN